jgi:hypothetical protein
MRRHRIPILRHPVAVMHMYARVDQAFESHVHRFLRDAKDESGNKIFKTVIKHYRLGLMRRLGVELSAQKIVNGEEKWISFAVTTSKPAFERARLKHPEVRIFYTPIHCDLHKLLKSILKFF